MCWIDNLLLQPTFNRRCESYEKRIQELEDELSETTKFRKDTVEELVCIIAHIQSEISKVTDYNHYVMNLLAIESIGKSPSTFDYIINL